ncbi:MAG: hypothetical protein N3Z28_05000 [Synechococcaceae cyanobacterium MAG-AL2]|uniref:FitA-like ribbon-helix-helix domain-containing protein n=1 Tax=Candidatus Regnicoccus frigidus TaxID=3074015 RepID=UPI002817DB52|nr:hypothetical protein [Candidatus Regnicoccus frigidus]MCT4367011.1 hypothetical protein [Candidatus Regnicoccus frigidus MAG-AL2]
MATISVRGLDDSQLERLKQEARAEGVSLNRRVLQVLQGSTATPKSGSHHDLDALIGAWNDEDAAEFAAAVAPFEAIDPALWK